MGLKDVGVRFVTEGLAQFNAALGSANKSVAGVGTAATDASKTVQKGWAGLKSTLTNPAMWSMAAGYVGVVVGALGSAAAAAKKYADEYMAYALQVKDFGRTIGASAEESSKLIQVADDVRLNVSSMTTAFRTAITRGIEPTVENLGKLSDQYLAIQDPIQRSKFLLDTFGRAGLEMGKLMELGSVKLKAMGDSIEGTSRLMTSAGIEAADKYWTALDNLNDKATELKLSAGQIAIQIVTVGLEEAIEGINLLEQYAKQGLETVAVTDMLSAAEKNQTISSREAAIAMLDFIQGEITAQEVSNGLITLTYQQAVAENELGTSYTGTGYSAVEAMRATVGLQASRSALKVTNDEAAASENNLATATENANQAYDYARTAISKYVDDAALAQKANDLLALATGKLTVADIELRDNIYSLTQMMAEKKVTPEQWANIIATLGDTTTDATQKIAALRAVIESLHDKTVTISVNVPGRVGGMVVNPPARPANLPTNSTGTRTAKGGDFIVPSGFNHDNYPVWVTSGERVVVMTAQQQREMNRSLFSGMMGSVSQTASPSQIYTNNTSSVNVSMPISATVRNDADIRVLAYAISKEIAANVRA